MGFLWETISSGGSVEASHVNEMRTNINAIAAAAGLTAFAWIHLPVSVGNDITAAGVNELKSATDYLHDSSPLCTSDNTSYNASIDTSECNSNLYNYDSAINNTALGTIYGTYYSAENASHETSVDNHHFRSDNYGHCPVVYFGHLGSR